MYVIKHFVDISGIFLRLGSRNYLNLTIILLFVHCDNYNITILVQSTDYMTQYCIEVCGS